MIGTASYHYVWLLLTSPLSRPINILSMVLGISLTKVHFFRTVFLYSHAIYINDQTGKLWCVHLVQGNIYYEIYFDLTVGWPHVQFNTAGMTTAKFIHAHILMQMHISGCGQSQIGPLIKLMPTKNTLRIYSRRTHEI